MLRIDCPCCGPRDHDEFRYGGDASVARPAHDDPDPEAWYRYVYVRTKSCGPPSRILAARDRLPAVAGGRARHAQPCHFVGRTSPGDRRHERCRTNGCRGGRIDRSHPIDFTFDGRKLTGYPRRHAGLGAARQRRHLVGRSFKYHRPRGIFSAGAGRTECAGDARNRWPARAEPAGDDARAGGRHGRGKPEPLAVARLRRAKRQRPVRAVPVRAGFYYKTFMGPTRRAWMFYEHFIRRAGGLGEASTEPDPDRYEVRHAFADVAVVGGGPAGLSAARAAATAGARVALIEQDFRLGGQLLAERSDGAGSIMARRGRSRTARASTMSR